MGFLGRMAQGKVLPFACSAHYSSRLQAPRKVAGFNIDSEANEVRKRIGLVSEKLIMYTRLTAEQNLMFFGKLYGMDNAELKSKVERIIGYDEADALQRSKRRRLLKRHETKNECDPCLNS